MEDKVVAMNEMREAYSNMLDIDGSSLSADFLESAENLDLMKQAAEGSEEAYQQLMDKAQEEIVAKIGLDDTTFNAGKDSIMDAIQELTNKE